MTTPEHIPTQPSETNKDSRNYSVLRRTLAVGGVVVVALVGGWKLREQADKVDGPKFGIDYVVVSGCGQVDGEGPINYKDGKRVLREFVASGSVSVELTTQEVSERDLREPGLINDPAVNLNVLSISCSDETSVAEENQLAAILP